MSDHPYFFRKISWPGMSHTAQGLTLNRVKGNYKIGCLTSIFALCIYLITLAPDITWANFSSDSGELITAAVTLGIPHPPGYPTYVLLGKLFSLIPIGPIAFRFNLLSALSASFAAGFVAVTALESLGDSTTARSAALATGLTIAFAPLIWSQAVITEVYTLNLALISILLWSLLGRRSALLTGVLFGLAITTHLTSIFLLPMIFMLVKSEQRSRLIGGLFLGLSPLLTLPILAKQGSPVIWGNPINLLGWLWLVSGQLYSANLTFQDSFGILIRLSTFGEVILNQFAVLGWALILFGIVTDQKGHRKNVWLLITVLLYSLFSFFYQTPDSILFLMPSLLLISPILAAGFSKIGHFSLLLPFALLVLNFSHQSLQQEQSIRPLIEILFDEIPQDSIILTPGDQTIFTLWYFNHVEGHRPDIRLVDANLFAFDWYRDRLKTQYPDLNGIHEDDLELFRSLNEKIRPFCTLSLQSVETVNCHLNSEP